MTRQIIAFFAAVGVLAAQASFAAVTVQVIPMYQPNGAANTPGWMSFVPRAIDELKNEDGTGDGIDRDLDAGAVEYAPISGSGLVNPSEMVVTAFESWRGVAAPNVPTQANERGNRLGFAMIASGTNGDQISLDTLVGTLQWKNIDGSPSDVFSSPVVQDFSGFDYSSTRVGMLNDGTMIMSGPGTQKVDQLFYVGLGDGLCPDGFSCVGDTMISDQMNVDDVLLKLEGNPQQTIMTTYEIEGWDPMDNPVSGMGMGSVTLVPEPSSVLLVLAGIALACRFRA